MIMGALLASCVKFVKCLLFHASQNVACLFFFFIKNKRAGVGGVGGGGGLCFSFLFSFLFYFNNTFVLCAKKNNKRKQLKN